MPWHKHPLFLIVFTVALLVGVYFYTSPIQNCVRHYAKDSIGENRTLESLHTTCSASRSW